ncbi:hypothetical protein BON22_1901 [Cyberlindnera fabianii]|uniref:Uncharacterized protein n=1 Tax=Cyberlindnera fabianii TaxID=36022 RepID=A0A1V2L894_CYBFA|nr:hypothetical protein BON22_1901 [Cyberlindnera fabianii]
MTGKLPLPNEVISVILSHVDPVTISQSLSQISELKPLLTLTVTDSQKSRPVGNVITIQEILERNLPLDSIIANYNFFDVHITQFEDEKVYLGTHRFLARLLRHKKDVRIVYHPSTVNMTYLKMFKSLFHSMPPVPLGVRNPHHISFPNVTDIRSNGNHLLISPQVEYPALETMNLYYCSSKFYFEVFDYLNLDKHKNTFPRLINLKLEDYMNEGEDLYSKNSDNYVRLEEFDEDYDDYDHSSDLDENEFYFDGLELLQNYKLTRLETLTLKNCNVSRLKDINAPLLRSLKMLEITNKHIEAFDLNLVDSDHIQTRSFLSSSVSTSCSIQGNDMPSLKTFKIIGHIKLKDFSANKMRLSHLEEVVVKGTNVEIDNKDAFSSKYSKNNQLII